MKISAIKSLKYFSKKLENELTKSIEYLLSVSDCDVIIMFAAIAHECTWPWGNLSSSR